MIRTTPHHSRSSLPGFQTREATLASLSGTREKMAVMGGELGGMVSTERDQDRYTLYLQLQRELAVPRALLPIAWTTRPWLDLQSLHEVPTQDFPWCFIIKERSLSHALFNHSAHRDDLGVRFPNVSHLNSSREKLNVSICRASAGLLCKRMTGNFLRRAKRLSRVTGYFFSVHKLFIRGVFSS